MVGAAGVLSHWFGVSTIGCSRRKRREALGRMWRESVRLVKRCGPAKTPNGQPRNRLTGHGGLGRPAKLACTHTCSPPPAAIRYLPQSAWKVARRQYCGQKTRSVGKRTGVFWLPAKPGRPKMPTAPTQDPPMRSAAIWSTPDGPAPAAWSCALGGSPAAAQQTRTLETCI